MHAGVVGQLAALLVPGAGHSEDAEVVQDAAAAMTPGHEGRRQKSCWAAERTGNTGMLSWAHSSGSVPAGWDEVEHGQGHQTHQRTLH